MAIHQNGRKLSRTSIRKIYSSNGDYNTPRQTSHGRNFPGNYCAATALDSLGRTSLDDINWRIEELRSRITALNFDSIFEAALFIARSASHIFATSYANSPKGVAFISSILSAATPVILKCR
jgi:hypothetical protein